MRRARALSSQIALFFAQFSRYRPASWRGRMSTDVMIYANELSKSFGPLRAVDKINFEVRRGEIVGFLGPNGAGKSTTMRILTCFIAPTAGTARIKGHDVLDESIQVRQSLGYLPQRAPLYLEMSVLEYLRFA